MVKLCYVVHTVWQINILKLIQTYHSPRVRPVRSNVFTESFILPPPKLLIIYNFKSQDGNYNVYYNTIVSWVYYNTVNEVQYNTVPGDQAGLQAGLQRTSGALKSPDPGFKPEMSGSRFQTWNVRIQVSNLEIYGREYNIILINRWPCFTPYSLFPALRITD